MKRGKRGNAGRFLDELLVAALERAFALAELNDVAVRVAEDLDFDVSRAREKSERKVGKKEEKVLLEEEMAVAEVLLGFVATTGDCFGEMVRIGDDSHALMRNAGERGVRDRRRPWMP